MHRKRRLCAVASSRGTQSRRILVVDDDPVICSFDAEALARSGYQVDTAEDGAAAWDALQVKHYDLLITDNQMPKVSGLELIIMLRSGDPDLPVILVSGAIPTQQLSRYPCLHLAATLSKPFTGNQLLGTVKKVLRQKPSAREQSESVPTRQSQPLLIPRK